MGQVADSIHEKLTAAFAPEHLEVIDDSAKHKGHAGARPEGESHFTVVIRASSLTGLSRVAQQRAIYDVLSDEMKGPVHALALSILPTP